MKKKLFALVVSGVFLLTSFSVVSALGMKADVSEQAVTNVDDLPDLAYDGESIRDPGNRESRDIVMNLIDLENVYEEEWVTVKIWYDGYPDSVIYHNYFKKRCIDEVCRYVGYHLFKRPAKGLLYIVNLEIDPPYDGHPNGDIIETDEYNNRASFELLFPPKSKQVSINPFLLSFSVVSAVGMKADVSEQSSKANSIERSGDDLPDFYNILVTASRIPDPEKENWISVGGVEVLQYGADYPTDVKVPVRIWIDGYPETERDVYAEFVQEFDEYPGLQLWTTPHGYYFDRPSNKHIFKVIAKVDPDNIIEEQDDDNNVGASYVVFSKNRYVFHPCFFNLLQRYPIFSKLLGL